MLKANWHGKYNFDKYYAKSQITEKEKLLFHFLINIWCKKVNHPPFISIPISSKMFSFLGEKNACKINVKNFGPHSLFKHYVSSFLFHIVMHWYMQTLLSEAFKCNFHIYFLWDYYSLNLFPYLIETTCLFCCITKFLKWTLLAVFFYLT